MLEALLKHFRSYGMNDLEFIIVNSKLSHSQDKLYELQDRVSFDVFQETDEEEVWSVMDGGKDDMYVYDRCGRLTYFIPFPLSILTESPLVSNAVLATYYRSPCGASCDQNKSLEMDEIVKNIEQDFEASNATEQESIVYEGTEQYITNNETINETLTSNDLFAVIDSTNELTISNSSDIADYITDDYYPTYNASSHLNDTNSTSMDKAKTFFNHLYKLFFNIENSNETFVDANDNSTLNSVLSNETNVQTEIPNDLQNHTLHNHSEHEHKIKIDERDKKKSDRCLEADYEVCKSWSKKRLLNAQMCCSSPHSGANFLKHKSCSNFGKKRCKKIQSILKCCIKTVYTEHTTTEPSTQLPTQTTEINHFVCCKRTAEEKFCRVLTSGDCEDDEERSPKTSK